MQSVPRALANSGVINFPIKLHKTGTHSYHHAHGSIKYFVRFVNRPTPVVHSSWAWRRSELAQITVIMTAMIRSILTLFSALNSLHSQAHENGTRRAVLGGSVPAAVARKQSLPFGGFRAWPGPPLNLSVDKSSEWFEKKLMCIHEEEDCPLFPNSFLRTQSGKIYGIVTIVSVVEEVIGFRCNKLTVAEFLPPYI